MDNNTTALLLHSVRKKRDHQCHVHNYDKFKYNVIFGKQHHESKAKLRVQLLSALPN